MKAGEEIRNLSSVTDWAQNSGGSSSFSAWRAILRKSELKSIKGPTSPEIMSWLACTETSVFVFQFKLYGATPPWDPLGVNAAPSTDMGGKSLDYTRW